MFGTSKFVNQLQMSRFLIANSFLDLEVDNAGLVIILYIGITGVIGILDASLFFATGSFN